MTEWLIYALAAALLYGLHQIFTKLAAPHIGDGLGGLTVETSAAATIGLYLAILWLSGSWQQKASAAGFVYSVATGVCVGLGTIAFFLLFQKGGPLSAVPMVLAVGAAVMALVGIVWFREAASPDRLLGIAFSILGLFLLRK